MGFGGISIWQLLIVLAIVLLLFGTKRLKSIGADLGNAIKGFRSALSESESESDKEAASKKLEDSSVKRTAEGEQPAGVSGGTAATDAASQAKDKEKA